MTRKNVLRIRILHCCLSGRFVPTSARFFTFAVGLYVLELSNAFTAYISQLVGLFLLATPIGGFIADRLNMVRIIYITDYMRDAIIIVSGYIFP